jgi:hypothetical protein
LEVDELTDQKTNKQTQKADLDRELLDKSSELEDLKLAVAAMRDTPTLFNDTDEGSMTLSHRGEGWGVEEDVAVALALVPTLFNDPPLDVSFEKGSMTLCSGGTRGATGQFCFPLPRDCIASWKVEVEGDGARKVIVEVGVTGDNSGVQETETCCYWSLHNGRGFAESRKAFDPFPDLALQGTVKEFMVSLDTVSRTLILSSPSTPPLFPKAIQTICGIHFTTYGATMLRLE